MDNVSHAHLPAILFVSVLVHTIGTLTGLELEYVAMVKRAPARRRPRKAKPGTKGLAPGESRLEKVEGPAAEALATVEKAGGTVIAMYREPLGGHPCCWQFCP